MDTKTILIIEDSYTSLLLLENTLKLEGYETQLALSVKEAIELITKQIPDLIILDLNMPEISGYDFLNMRDQLKIVNCHFFSSIISTSIRQPHSDFLDHALDNPVTLSSPELGKEIDWPITLGSLFVYNFYGKLLCKNQVFGDWPILSVRWVVFRSRV